MTKEARVFIAEYMMEKFGFDPIQDEVYAIVPEGRRDIAVVRAMIEKKRENYIFLVWINKKGKLQKIELKESSGGKDIHVDQILIQNKEIIISIDSGEGYSKRHLMEKLKINLSELKGLK